MSSVAWPIHVTVAFLVLARNNAPSLSMGTSGLVRGCTVVDQPRERMNFHRCHSLGLRNRGLRFRKPCLVLRLRGSDSSMPYCNGCKSEGRHQNIAQREGIDYA